MGRTTEQWIKWIDKEGILERCPTRASLALYCEAAYRSLLRAGLLDEIYPDTDREAVERGRKAGRTRHLQEDILLQALIAYGKYDGRITRMAQHLGISYTTLIRHLSRGMPLLLRGNGKR